jgi:hypothetical protein
MKPKVDLATQATALLREQGPVEANSPHGDFGVITFDDGLGWVVTCHYNDILTFVGPDEARPGAADLVVGLVSRNKRDRDARALRVLHVEDRRSG